MSGHSKWSTIKRKKGAEDAKRGKMFTRLAREITVAAREGGGDESANAKLKLAISRARASNMPKDNIERAVKRGTGDLDEGSQMEEITYEAYGPDGVAYLVDVLTDNRNRALAEVKRTFTRAGGSLAATGSVTWQFEKKGYITLKGGQVDFEEVFMVAAEAGAEDVTSEDDRIIVFTPRDRFAAVEHALTEAGYEIDEAELRWEPKNETSLDTEPALQNMRLLDHLEELDDVQSVASNLLITDDLMAAFENA